MIGAGKENRTVRNKPALKALEKVALLIAKLT